MPKMDPKLKAEWVEALRSGEYKQGSGALLSQDGGYCCLGVLAEILGELRPNGFHIHGNSCYLATFEVGASPKYFHLDELEQKTLAAMNDERQMDFNAIALYIEAHL